ncbi:MAG: putative thioesterase involved in non-ribosomal peptide biosynthesis [Bryobacterales bacterium]|nr:putative thioesterase involved in non-ribosomal peptide biosynthesis [Bryobacterales bacterium]
MLKIVTGLLLAVSCTFGADATKIVLIAGKPSHGPEQHEFNAGTMLLEKCLRQNSGVETVVVKGGWPENESVFDGARALVFYMDGGQEHPMIEDGRLAKIRALMQKGVGLVCLHYAVEVPKDKGGAELLDWIGGFYDRPYSQNPVNDVAVTQASPRHPISRGWKSFTARDEFYYKMRFRPGDTRVTPILTTMVPKDTPQREVIAWAVERADGGRGFGFTGGHYHRNWGIPDFRRMVVNAILWSAKMDVPTGGAKCDISPEDLSKNLDPKPPEK